MSNTTKNIKAQALGDIASSMANEPAYPTEVNGTDYPGMTKFELVALESMKALIAKSPLQMIDSADNNAFNLQARGGIAYAQAFFKALAKEALAKEALR